mmetsp:Transcript_138116/g.195498  ORF Transcript_138116/g.195498 Transcript_138116/m.195498 type:complete len:107 (+) Transcript_138116:636-956(+)
MTCSHQLGEKEGVDHLVGLCSLGVLAIAETVNSLMPHVHQALRCCPHTFQAAMQDFFDDRLYGTPQELADCAQEAEGPAWWADQCAPNFWYLWTSLWSIGPEADDL